MTDKTPITLDDISDALTKILRGKVGRIYGGAYQQEEFFNPKKWKDYFCGSEEISSDLNAILKTISEYEGREIDCQRQIIRRRHVFEIANEIKIASDVKEDDLRKTFLAVMIWGHGKAGYGPHRVGKIIKNSSGLLHVIKQICYLVKNGKIEDAYDIFASSKDIKGIGPSFSTKCLYFVSKYCKSCPSIIDGAIPRCNSRVTQSCEPRPLILDSMVAKALGRGESRIEHKGVWKMIEDYATSENRRDGAKKKDVLRYIAYVKGVDGCMKELRILEPKIKPDDIEHFLWKQGRG